jgi:hypothetical protein
LPSGPTDSPTGKNLATTRTVRLGLGHTRDVIMIDGEVEASRIDTLPREVGDRFAIRTAGKAPGDRAPQVQRPEDQKGLVLSHPAHLRSSFLSMPPPNTLGSR